MPLPSASRLYYPYPKPTTVDEHATNLQQSVQWADRLPFFGPSAAYFLSPTGTFSTNATGYPNPVLATFNDGFQNPVAAYPYDGTADGLLLPYQKQEDWTSIRVDAHISVESNTANRFFIWRLLILPVDYFTSGVLNQQQPPSNRPPNGAAGLQYMIDFFFDTANERQQISDHIIIKPHPRGAWVAQVHWYTLLAGGGTGTLGSTIYVNTEDRWKFTFTECPPQLPAWEGDLT